MSKTYELISFEDNKLTLNEEGINFLKSIKEEIIIIALISSLEETISTNSLNLLSSLTKTEIQEILNNNTVTIHTTPIRKESSHMKILFLNINCSDKHLLSLLFFASSLFIFCVDGNINQKELNRFLLINSLYDTIKLNDKKNKETFFRECAPELIFYITNFNSTLSNDYLETELNKKENNKKINLLKENIIKFFPERSIITDEDNKKNDLLVNKIIEEINPKNIKGKLFDGNSFSFFLQKFLEMHKKNGNPNFDELFGKLINNDLEVYKNEALNYFNSEMIKLDQIENEEKLIPKIYQIKIDSFEKFNNINYLIHDIFNKPEYKNYKNLYNNIKSELENKFTEQENLKILKNLQKSELNCNELLNKFYENINQKIMNGKYNGSNIDEYINDYETFLNNYKNTAKGNNKLKCLINFLEINKPKYFKCLVEGGGIYTIESQERNEEKIKDIEEMKDKIERKKREIKHLRAEMDRIEEDIKKAHSLDEITSQNQNQNHFETKYSK